MNMLKRWDEFVTEHPVVAFCLYCALAASLPWAAFAVMRATL